MFGFIRNIFRNKPEEQQEDWDWTKGKYALTFKDWPSFPPSSSKRTEHLTQRDLQILQSILAKHIQVADIVRKEIKEEALEYEVGDDLRSVLFGEHRKVKDYLKKLSALQHRLKHKIAVRG